MSTSSRNYHTHNHTVILKSRVVPASTNHKSGSLSGDSSVAMHSKPKPPPQVSQKLFQTPSREPPRTRVSPETFYEYKSPASSLLVRFGLDSYLGRMVTRILIALILFQPVYVAMGMELEDTASISPSGTTEDEGGVNSDEVEEVTEAEDFVVPDVDISEGEQAGVESEEVASDDDVADIVSETSDDDMGSLDTDTTDDALDEETTSLDDDAPLSDESEEGIEEGTTEIENTSDGGFDEGNVDENDVDSDVGVGSLEEIATTSDEIVGVAEIPVVQNIESKYVFGEGDCTLVSEGEFYCVAAGPERQVSSGDPRVYAEKDREGDREIFYFDGVEVQRITNNSYDDFAPVFDDETLRIVWQAMLNDRLQIMVHDVPTNTTRQITTTRENSSNPSIAGDTVVWQEWIGTNWEIMITDIDDIGQEFEIEQLTDNMVHDMFPAAYDGLITWQSERGSSWEVVVYDLHTEKKQTLEKNEGTKYENPRFVLLFDSKHDNGDIETIGYDLDTGEKMELGTRANPQPKIPASPKDEAPDAIPREEKIEDVVVVNDTEGDGGGDGDDGNTTTLGSVNDSQVATASGTTPVVFDNVIELSSID